MATREQHIIDIKAKGAKQSQKQIKGVGTSLKGLAKNAAMAAGAYFGARALLGGIQQSIELFGQQEMAEKKLEAALGHTSQALLDHAKALQEVTMFGDETIIEAQALIGAFIKDEDAIAKATEATLDLAAAKGFDLVAAADLVSKTLGSSTNALTRYGIEVKGAVGSTERLESLTTNIAKVFGGQATEQTNTMAGAMQQMKNAVGDAAEVLGETMAPIVVTIAGKLKSAAEAFQSFVFETTATETEIAIKNLKEMGVDTTQLEMNLVQLQKNKAMQELGESFFTVGTNASTIVTKQKEIADLTIAERERQNAGIDLQNRIIELTNDEMSISTLRGEILKNYRGDQDDALLAQVNGLIAEQEALETSREQYEADVKARKDEIKDRQALEEIKIQEEALQKKINKLESDRGVTIKANLVMDKEQADTAKKTLAFGVKAAHVARSELGFKKGIIVAIEQAGIKERAKQVKGALRDAYGSGVKAYKWGTAIGGPFFGAAMAAIATAAALAIASKVQSFAEGGNFITSGPELIMVGDNPSGRERVQVTPLGAGGGASQQSSSINLTINSPIMSEDYTEDVIIPHIKEALKIGYDVG